VPAFRLEIALLLACACGGPDPGSIDLPAPSFTRFAQEVEPVVERRCSSPACHGDAARPFALYAPLRRRLDPARLFLGEPCTPDEVRRNWEATRGFLPELLLCKPLDEPGCRHGGGAVFASGADPEYLRLVEWAESAP
jgi:hypothetical protein